MSEQPEGPQDRPGARSGSLADAMRSQVEEEVRGVTEAAGKEAVDIVRSARRVARLRLHKAVQAMRSERRNAIQRATAQLHAAERRQRYNTEMAVLGEAMTALRQAVGERWRKADDRRQWCLSLVDAAKDRLEPGTWTIEHPQDWEPERDNALVAALKEQLGALPAFKPDETIDAGIRIRGDHSCLDGTLDGLLVRRNWVEAALLAQLGEKMPGEMSAGGVMSKADIRWAGGPLIHARPEGVFAIGEAVAVGERELLGEVIRVSRERIVAQVYGDTTGLRPGDRVEGSGRPLSVRLGPHLLGNIFDGLLQPLGAPFEKLGDFRFKPLVEKGASLGPGARIAETGSEHRPLWLLVPPDLSGTVERIDREGAVALDKPVCIVRDEKGAEHELSLIESWPVRTLRPAQRRLAVDTPMITGQRILDSLFPVARGGRAAIPGGFGTGKTVLQETLAKWCDADIIIYVGCGERGNEMAEVLNEFPQLTDPRTGRPLMERTVIIANTSNMPVAAREASIYTAVTVGEWFRDQGLHVALMADSTSRWAEALREVSGRLGELPAEAGYPAYLSSRLAEFYERAARVETLGGTEGSLTLIGAVSPPAGDFSEPVTSHTKRYVRSFWGLDRERAQARFYPAIHPLQSYSEDADAFAAWWAHNGNADWPSHRRRLLKLLEEQARLERMARIVGKDALPPAQQLAINAAELVNETILRQSAYSPVDRFCSPARQTRMIRLVIRVIELGETALAAGVAPSLVADLPVMRTIKRLGEEVGEDNPAGFDALEREVEAAFSRLMRGEGDEG